jgi:uncharacterized protein YecE (DUF72 family)
MLAPLGSSEFQIGTMGFSYSDWKGVFYPLEMKPRSYLGYYSRIFNAVEIDSTFYGTPRLETVQRWAAVTPEDFKFCLKVPREITHEAGLEGVRAPLNQFLQVVSTLGDKLGALLFQFPPSFQAARLPVLQRFLPLLTDEFRFALEVRHPSWYTAKVPGSDELKLAEALRKSNVCWAATDYPGLPPTVIRTTDFLYLRWIGQHGSYQNHDHERIDLSDRLKSWWRLIQSQLGDLSALYGFFNNDYAGFAAGTANRFKGIVGLPVEPLKPPQQGRLF